MWWFLQDVFKRTEREIENDVFDAAVDVIQGTDHPHPEAAKPIVEKPYVVMRWALVEGNSDRFASFEKAVEFAEQVTANTNTHRLVLKEVAQIMAEVSATTTRHE